MPCNVFGINDSYKGKRAHVIPALIQKFHSAIEKKESTVSIWGTGLAKREFIYSEDLGEICRSVLIAPADKFYKVTSGRCHVNAGSGIEISIKELAKLIGRVCGFAGDLVFDSSFPDGTPRKLLDSSACWELMEPKIQDLEYCLKLTYENFLENHAEG